MTVNKNALAQALSQGEFIVAPGVYDMISARLADKLGFPALYMTGYGTVASYLGLPQTTEELPVPYYRDMHSLMGFPEVWEFEKQWAMNE